MYRLFPCIPIFRGFFLLKVQKGCVYVIMLKIALVLFKICFDVKKCISRLLRYVAAKHTAVEFLEVIKKKSCGFSTKLLRLVMFCRTSTKVCF